MKDLQNFIAYAKTWEGYAEKKNANMLGQSMKNPEHFTNGQGKENYTIFAKDYKKHTGIDVQGQPWCDTFVDMLFIEFFGLDDARRKLGGFSAWTPSSADMFKKRGKWSQRGEVGHVIFFKNDVRIYHTGLVIDVNATHITTIEGNTSRGSNTVEANGGSVCIKTYDRRNARIAGYGVVDYDTVVKNGWYRIDNSWQFYQSGNRLENQIFKYEGLYYHVDGMGVMSRGQFYFNGKRYVACDGGKYDGAILKIDA